MFLPGDCLPALFCNDNQSTLGLCVSINRWVTLYFPIRPFVSLSRFKVRSWTTNLSSDTRLELHMNRVSLNERRGRATRKKMLLRVDLPNCSSSYYFASGWPKTTSALPLRPLSLLAVHLVFVVVVVLFVAIWNQVVCSSARFFEKPTEWCVSLSLCVDSKQGWADKEMRWDEKMKLRATVFVDDYDGDEIKAPMAAAVECVAAGWSFATATGQWKERVQN